MNAFERFYHVLIGFIFSLKNYLTFLKFVFSNVSYVYRASSIVDVLSRHESNSLVSAPTRHVAGSQPGLSISF